MINRALFVIDVTASEHIHICIQSDSNHDFCAGIFLNVCASFF